MKQEYKGKTITLLLKMKNTTKRRESLNICCRHSILKFVKNLKKFTKKYRIYLGESKEIFRL